MYTLLLSTREYTPSPPLPRRLNRLRQLESFGRSLEPSLNLSSWSFRDAGLIAEQDISPTCRYKRANAAFVALVRNNEREAMRDSMRSVEMRGNRRWGYPWFVCLPASVLACSLLTDVTTSEQGIHE